MTFFSIDDRPIVRHADDAIVREVGGREMVLRRARGFAPLSVLLPETRTTSQLACTTFAGGAHLKNRVALRVGRNAFLSQHIGDLETYEAYEAFKRVIADFTTLYDARPTTFVCDRHPDYLSARYARLAAERAYTVQHHVAHVAACMADNDLDATVFGVSWDGTGYGTDRTIWGGEFFVAKEGTFCRVGTFRRFLLPGGEHAVKEPHRTALGVLFELFGEEGLQRNDIASVAAFTEKELVVLQHMLVKRLNSRFTSSVGRLFDAVSSLVGLRHQVRHEGQAAMELEFAFGSVAVHDAYPFRLIRQAIDGASMSVVDWGPAILAVLDDVGRGAPLALIAGRFHNMLVDVIVAQAQEANAERVVLSGGCFQNLYLTERTIERLRQSGFRPYARTSRRCATGGSTELSTSNSS
ncbi:MAG: hypothetical protein C4326_15095 [Ignavibacteria bacterium]